MDRFELNNCSGPALTLKQTEARGLTGSGPGDGGGGEGHATPCGYNKEQTYSAHPSSHPKKHVRLILSETNSSTYNQSHTHTHTLCRPLKIKILWQYKHTSQTRSLTLPPTKQSLKKNQTKINFTNIFLPVAAGSRASCFPVCHLLLGPEFCRLIWCGAPSPYSVASQCGEAPGSSRRPPSL